MNAPQVPAVEVTLNRTVVRGADGHPVRVDPASVSLVVDDGTRHEMVLPANVVVLRTLARDLLVVSHSIEAMRARAAME